MAVQEVATITREYYRVPITLTAAGVAIDPTSLHLDVAVVLAGVDPVDADWKSGTWETYLVRGAPIYLARAFVGDATTDFPLVVGTLYDVWLRITDSPERPVRNVGQIRGI